MSITINMFPPGPAPAALTSELLCVFRRLWWRWSAKVSRRCSWSRGHLRSFTNFTVNWDSFSPRPNCPGKGARPHANSAHSLATARCNLSLLCPAHSFPSRFVIGRSRGEATADRRKDELNGYVWHLIHAAPDVTQVRIRSSRGRGRSGSSSNCRSSGSRSSRSRSSKSKINNFHMNILTRIIKNLAET